MSSYTKSYTFGYHLTDDRLKGNNILYLTTHQPAKRVRLYHHDRILFVKWLVKSLNTGLLVSIIQTWARVNYSLSIGLFSGIQIGTVIIKIYQMHYIGWLLQFIFRKFYFPSTLYVGDFNELWIMKWI